MLIWAMIGGGWLLAFVLWCTVRVCARADVTIIEMHQTDEREAHIDLERDTVEDVRVKLGRYLRQ